MRDSNFKAFERTDEMIAWIKAIPVLLLGLVEAVKAIFKISKTIQRKDPEQIVVDNAEVIKEVKEAKNQDERKKAARKIANRINKL